jgi:acetyl-CoA acetyltransferase
MSPKYLGFQKTAVLTRVFSDCLCAVLCSVDYGISREEQDDFSLRSYELSQKSIADGLFEAEICPVRTQAMLPLRVMSRSFSERLLVIAGSGAAGPRQGPEDVHTG